MQQTKLIDFKDLNEEEIKMVYEWRNNDKIRHWMFNSEIIPFDEHIAFIDKLKSLEDDNMKYFLVLESSNYVGVISFKNIDLALKQCDIGLYSNPNKKGSGKLLINQCVNYGLNFLGLSKIIVEVFEDNEKAIHSYKKAYFKRTGKKIIKDKEVICMELISKR